MGVDFTDHFGTRHSTLARAPSIRTFPTQTHALY